MIVTIYTLIKQVFRVKGSIDKIATGGAKMLKTSKKLIKVKLDPLIIEVCRLKIKAI